MKKIIIFALFIAIIMGYGIGYATKKPHIIWKIPTGQYLMEYDIDDLRFVVGLRDDGVIVWKYIDNQQNR